MASDECHWPSLWWQVNFGSGNGLVPSGNKPFTWASVDPDLCRHMASLGHNEINAHRILWKFLFLAKNQLWIHSTRGWWALDPILAKICAVTWQIMISSCHMQWQLSCHDMRLLITMKIGERFSQDFNYELINLLQDRSLDSVSGTVIYINNIRHQYLLPEWSRFSIETKMPYYPCLTHWGRDKMDAISQTTFSNAFSWMKMLEF